MNLMWVFLAISVFLLLIVLYVISQSRKIENERLHAQAGLLEAKERYRALVEASNEGYMLMIEGRSMYSNHTLQRMLGYDEKELAEPDIWLRLLPQNRVNTPAIGHLQDIIEGRRTTSEFEAQLQTKSGPLVDVIITVSKIFFSEKNGHVVTIRRISSESITSTGRDLDNIREFAELPTGILLEIDSSLSEGHIIHTLSRVPAMVKEMTVNGIKSSAIRHAICQIFDAVMVKFINLAQAELGPEPVAFAFLTLGSNARHEMTMFSDQDNAIIFENVDKDRIDNVRRYFLKLADRVCTMLDKAGYPYCPGGIMAVNPRWCLALEEWESRFTYQTICDFDKVATEIHTIFDIRCIYGSKSLALELQQYMAAIVGDNPEFFLHLARNCLSYAVPLNVFGKFKTENIDGRETINIKNCIVPIVNMARIYALRNNINSPSTISRLSELVAAEVFTPEQFNEIKYVFDHLWYLRFYNQIICHSDLRRVNDELFVENLSDTEQQKLKESLVRVSTMQSHLSYDFLGVGLNG